MGYGFINDDIFQIPAEERSPQMIAIYSYLCNRAGAKGKCWPSYANIMDHTGIKTRATVIKYTKQLEKLGLIRIERRKEEVSKNLSNVYSITSLDGSLNEQPSLIDIPPSSTDEPRWFNENTRVVHSMNKGGSSNDTQTITKNNNREQEHITRTKNSVCAHKNFIDLLNMVSNQSFKLTPNIGRKIDEILNQGYSSEDIETVIAVKVPEFIKRDATNLIKPSFLFEPSRFGELLNEAKAIQKKEQQPTMVVPLFDDLREG